MSGAERSIRAVAPPVRIRQSDVDACPGALRLHAAADGPLARVRLPGGMLTGAQLADLAKLAGEYGDGWLELTSRANVQLRALNGVSPAALAARLWSAGMLPSEAHETVRNIAAPPLAGDQIRRLVRALDEAICADPALAALPGRFLFAIGRVPMDADVAAIPIESATAASVHETSNSVANRAGESADDHGRDADDRTFAIFLGNVDTGLRVAADAVVPTLTAAAHAFLAERAEDRSRERPAWRLRELPDGPARVAGRVAGMASHRETADTSATPPDSTPAAESTPVGIVGQEDGLFAVGTLVPLGRLGGVPVQLLAKANHLVVTAGRGIVVRDLPASAAETWKWELAAAGLEVDRESRWVGVTACAGKPGCAKALADVRADAEATTRHVDGLPVHWVGCARGCGSPAGPHVRVEATADGYVVGRGGTSAADADVVASTVDLEEIVAGARRH